MECRGLAKLGLPISHEIMGSIQVLATTPADSLSVSALDLTDSD